MKLLSKESQKLYDFNPAFMVLLFTPIGFVPIIGNLIIDLAFSVTVVFIVRKRFDGKAILKTTGISYFLSILVLFGGVILSFLMGGFYFMCVYGEPATYDSNIYPDTIQNLARTICFVTGTMMIFAANLFFTSRQIFRGINHKPIAKVVVSVILTLLNAPYLLFIPYEQAVYVDFNRYYPYVSGTSYDQQKSWISDDGYLAFKTIERFHRFRPSGDADGLLRLQGDNASDPDKIYSISFDDWVSDNGGHYNCGRVHAYYRNKGETTVNYHPIFSGYYYRNSPDALVFTFQSVNNDVVKTPYQAGDTISLHVDKSDRTENDI